MGYSLTLFSDYGNYPPSLPKLFEMVGTVAQSVEQRTENPRVGGSIPSRPTTLIAQSSNAYGFFQVFFSVLATTSPSKTSYLTECNLLKNS